MTHPDRRPGRPFIIGITGNIACGKSIVMTELSRLGADTIDADAVYHQLIQSGSPLWRCIVDHFGVGIVAADGQIDRKILGKIVFSDPAALAELEAITYPAIRPAIVKRVTDSGASVVAIDAVKLIEGGLGEQCDSVWIVTCWLDQQIERLVARRGLSLEDAKRRVDAQPPVEPKLGMVDVLIDNSGDIESTLVRVRQVWAKLGLNTVDEAVLD